MANVVPNPGSQSHYLTKSAQNAFNTLVVIFSSPGQNAIRTGTGGLVNGNIPFKGSTVLIPISSTTNILTQFAFSVGSIFLGVFASVFFATFIVGSRNVKKIIKIINRIVDYFTTLNPPKYSDSKNRFVRIGFRICNWPFYFLNIFLRALTIFFSFSNITFLLTMGILVAVFLQLEEYQDEMLDYIDYVLIIGKDTINVFSAIVNTVGQTVSVFFVPIINAMITFVIQCFLITKDYVVPIYLKAVQESNAEQGGRRILDPAEIAFFGKEYFSILEATGGLISGFINILLSFYLAVWGILNWLFFAFFEDEIGDILKIMLNFVKGFYCYLIPDFLFCTFAQFVQYIIVFIAIILNGLLSLIFNLLPFGINPPRISTDFYSTQCDRAISVSGRTVTTDECIRCRPAFPGWINTCPDEKARRLLKIHCEDFTKINGTWNEKVFYDGVLVHTPNYYNHTSNWKGCPLSKDGLLYNNLGMHYKYNSLFDDCYDIVIDGETVIRCPTHEGVITSSNRRRLRNERNLLSIVDELNKKTQTTATTKDSDTTLINRKLFVDGYNKVINGFTWNSDSTSIFNCSDHDALNHSNIFDTFCALQGLTTRKEVITQIENQYNPSRNHESNVYIKFVKSKLSTTPSNHRLLEEEDTYRKIIRIDQIFNKISKPKQSKYYRRELKSQPKEILLVNITAADGTCPPGDYVKCPNSPYCEKPYACQCPTFTEPFMNKHQEADYNFYQTMCQIKQFDASQWIAEKIACWDRYRKRDTSSPLGAFVSPLQNAGNEFIRAGSAFETNIEYCFPLIDPTNWLIPKIEDNFSLRDYYATKYCKDVNANHIVSQCMCTGYKQGVNAKDGWWIVNVGYYLQARFYNWREVWATTFFAAFNMVCIGIINYIWSSFWRPLNAEPEWVTLFGDEFKLGNIGCATFHSGSWGFGNLFIFVWAMFFFGCCFTPFWYIATDLYYIPITFLGLDQTINFFNLKHGEQLNVIKYFKSLREQRKQNEKQKENDEEIIEKTE